MGLVVAKAPANGRAVRVGLMLRPMLALLTALAVAAPFGVYTVVQQFENNVLDQEGLTSSALTGEQLDLYRELAAAGGSDVPLLLSYHDVRTPDAEDLAEQEEQRRLDELGDDTGSQDIYTVTPDLFADHMSMLRSAGYHTITIKEFVAWLDGEPLQKKSVLLTFDDGTTGLWRYVDPILEEHDMVATAFIITGRVGTARPYYLTWDELDLMAESGRWDIESHTHLGHDRIAVSPDGDPQPFLINRAWLPEWQRIETLNEFETRVGEDLDQSLLQLQARGFARPRLMAFPFSAERRPTNDPAAPGIANRLLGERFTVTVTNVKPDRVPSQRDLRRGLLPRIEVFTTTSTDELIARIIGAQPLAITEANPLSMPELWIDSGGSTFVASDASVDVSHRAAQFRLIDRQLFLSPPAETFLGADFAPGLTADWIDYRLRTVVDGLGAGGTGTTASVTALVGAETEINVSVSANWFRVERRTEDGRRIVTEGSIETATRRELEVEVARSMVSVLVDGVEVVTVGISGEATGGFGIGVNRVGPDSPIPRFSEIEVQPAGVDLGPGDSYL